MPVVARLDLYASMLAGEFDETTANNPSITGLGTYYASEFNENVGITTTLTANVFAPYDLVYDEFGGTLFGAGQGRYMRQNTDKSVIVYNDIDEVTDLFGRGIVRDGLVLDLDAGIPASYSGSGTTWTDLSGNGNTGELVNGVGYNSGNLGSLVFDGTDDSSDFGNILQLGTESRTYCCWYRQGVTSFPTIVYLITKTDNASTAYRQALGFRTDGSIYVVLRGQSNVSYDTITTNPKNDTNWHYLVWVLDRTSNYLIYQDNILVDTKDISPIVSQNFQLNRPLRIGSYNTTDNEPTSSFNGNISQVSIYNRALSAAEVSQNYNSLKHRFGL